MKWKQTFQDRSGSAVPMDRSVFDLRAVGGDTKIDTDFGTIPARLLTTQHRLRELSGKFIDIEWVERLDLDPGFLDSHPDLRPVRIPAGRFRPDLPRRDLSVTPCTLIWAGDLDNSLGTFGAARMFAQVDAQQAASRDPVTYIVVACERRAMLRAEGMWVSC